MMAFDYKKALDYYMVLYIQEKGYALVISNKRYHHKIYLSDPRAYDVNKLKTVIKHPIKNVKEISICGF